MDGLHAVDYLEFTACRSKCQAKKVRQCLPDLICLKCDGDCSALAGLAFQLEPGAVVLRGVADDGKTQSRAADLLRVAFVDAVEPLKHTRLVGVGNADAGVRDTQNRPSGAFADRCRDAAAGNVIFDRVVEQIVDHFLEQLLHTLNFRMLSGQRQRHRLPRGGGYAGHHGPHRSPK